MSEKTSYTKRKPRQKPRNKVYNLEKLFNPPLPRIIQKPKPEPKPHKDIFDSKRTTNLLNKLFSTFTKDEVYYLGKLFKKEAKDESFNLDKLFKEKDKSKTYNLDKLYPDYYKANKEYPKQYDIAQVRGLNEKRQEVLNLR
jgi:hypothetical protein